MNRRVFLFFLMISLMSTFILAQSRSVQLINGYAKIIEIQGSAKELYILDRGFLSYRGNDKSWQVSASDGSESITWRSATVPADAEDRVTFAFGAVFSIGDLGRFELLMNDRKLMNFSGSIEGDQNWTEGDISFKFDFLRSSRNHAAGVAYLTVPVGMLTPGEPVEFTVRGLNDNNNSSFILNDNPWVAEDPNIQPTVNPHTIPTIEPVTAQTLRYEGIQPMQVFNRPDDRQQQGLETLLSRGRVKPVELLTTEDENNALIWANERTIFRDEYTGAEVWKLTNSPYGVVRHAYSTILAWNANGSQLLFNTPFGPGSGLMDPWTGEIHQLEQPYSGIWSPIKPEVMYRSGEWNGKRAMVAYDWEQDKVLRGLAPIREDQVAQIHFPPSEDSKYIIWREGPQGRAPTFGFAATDGSLYRSISLTGDIIDEQSPVTFEEPAPQPGLDETRGGVHQQYFTRRPDHSVIIASNYIRPQEPMISLERIYTKDGELQYEGSNMSHQAWHPQGDYVIYLSYGSITALEPLTNKQRVVTTLTGTVDGHTSWTSHDPKWTAASFHSRGGGDIFRVSMGSDRSVIRLAGSNPINPAATAWDNYDFANLSPDGTKVLFMTSMSGSVNEYLVVAANPQAPTTSGKWTEDGYQLTIEPALSREIRGYRVYQTNRSGQDYQQIDFVSRSNTPIGSEENVSYLIEGVEPEDEMFYAVRAEEHSGLLSRYSKDVSVNKEPTAMIIEADEMEFTGFMQDFDPQNAGNMYYLFVPSYAPESSIAFNNTVASGNVWIRIAGNDVSFEVTAEDETIEFNDYNSDTWEWLNLGTLEGQVTLTSQSPGLHVDRIFITPDPGQEPVGRGLDYQPNTSFTQKTPGGIQAIAQSPFAVEVTWNPVRGSRYYNVHADDHPNFQPNQANLLYSPPEISRDEFPAEKEKRTIDWGLEPGSNLYYKVVAIDYDGNASQASEAVEVETPELEQVYIELEYDSTSNPEADEPLLLEKDQSIELTFEVPAEGDYVFWHKWRADSGDGIRLQADFNEEQTYNMYQSYDLSGLYGDALSEELIWNRFAFRNANAGSKEEHGVLRLEPGTNKLILTTNGPIYLDQLIITNDHSIVPDGKISTF